MCLTRQLPCYGDLAMLTNRPSRSHLWKTIVVHELGIMADVHMVDTDGVDHQHSFILRALTAKPISMCKSYKTVLHRDATS